MVHRARSRTARAVGEPSPGLDAFPVETLATPQATSGPVEVDDTSTGFSRSAGWIAGTSAGGNQGGYLYTGVRSQETASATWTPALAQAGPYVVSVHYVCGSNRTSDARFSGAYQGRICRRSHPD